MCVCVFVCIDVVCVLIAGVFATAAISSTCLGCKQLSHRTTAALLRGKVEARHFVRSRSAHIAARRSQPLHNVPMTCSSTRYQHTWRRYLTLRRSYAKINNLPRLQDALPFGPASPYRWGRAPCHLAWTARAPPPEHATPPVSQVQLGAAGSAMQVQCRLCSPRGCPAAPRSEADSSFFSGVRYSVLPQAMAALGKTLRSETGTNHYLYLSHPSCPPPTLSASPEWTFSCALARARSLHFFALRNAHHYITKTNRAAKDHEDVDLGGYGQVASICMRPALCACAALAATFCDSEVLAWHLAMLWGGS